MKTIRRILSALNEFFGLFEDEYEREILTALDFDHEEVDR